MPDPCPIPATWAAHGTALGLTFLLRKMAVDISLSLCFRTGDGEVFLVTAVCRGQGSRSSPGKERGLDRWWFLGNDVGEKRAVLPRLPRAAGSALARTGQRPPH